MYVDIAIEFDCSHEEFIYDGVLTAEHGDRWISCHTDKGKEFLEKFGISLELNSPIKISHDKFLEIYCFPREKTGLMILMGGFHWKDKSHTETL